MFKAKGKSPFPNVSSHWPHASYTRAVKNRYPVESEVGIVDTPLLGSDSSRGWCYLFFRNGYKDVINGGRALDCFTVFVYLAATLKVHNAGGWDERTRAGPAL